MTKKTDIEQLERTRRQREDSELTKFFDWVRQEEKADTRLCIIFHIPHTRYRSQHDGLMQKQKGVKAGVPTICAPIPSFRYCGLWIELKLGTGNLSIPKEAWSTLLKEQGHAWAVARSGEEAIEIVKRYLRDEEI